MEPYCTVVFCAVPGTRYCTRYEYLVPGTVLEGTASIVEVLRRRYEACHVFLVLYLVPGTNILDAGTSKIKNVLSAKKIAFFCALRTTYIQTYKKESRADGSLGTLKDTDMNC